MRSVRRNLQTGAAVGTAGLAAALLYLIGGRLRRAGGAVIVRRTLAVDAPVAQVFAFPARAENWPRFMGHLQAVTPVAGDRHRWVGAGPGGPLEWETVISRFGVNRALGWRTVREAPLRQVTDARLRPRGQSTSLELALCYGPVAGGDPAVVTRLLGPEPARALDEDLTRLATLLTPAAREGQGAAR